MYTYIFICIHMYVYIYIIYIYPYKIPYINPSVLWRILRVSPNLLRSHRLFSCHMSSRMVSACFYYLPAAQSCREHEWNLHKQSMWYSVMGLCMCQNADVEWEILPAPNTETACGWSLWSKHLQWLMMYLDNSGMFKHIWWGKIRIPAMFEGILANKPWDVRSKLSLVPQIPLLEV